MHRKVNSKSGTKFQSWIIAFREPRPGYLSISLYVWQGDRKVCTQAFTDSPKRNYKIVIHCNSVFTESCIQYTGQQSPYAFISEYNFFSQKSVYRNVKGTGSRISACSLHVIKLLFSNLLLIPSVNNPTLMYLSDLSVYFKVEVYFRVT